MTRGKSALSQRVKNYLSHGLLPLWAEHGWDRARGGCHERLEPDHSPSPLDYRRLTVCGRQLFVFSAAARSAAEPTYREWAERCYEHLVERFWDKRFGGWFFKLDLTGKPLDRTKDLYGQAFALFGLAHCYGAFRKPEALEIARETNRLIKRHLLLPTGWFASAAAEDWTHLRRALDQNPHMHLLEAYLALADATGEPAFVEDAAAIVELFHRRLFDARTGVLGEYFDESGAPHPTTGERVEPGHHFEWCWLLHEYARLRADPRTLPVAERLFEQAERYGVDPAHGGAFDALDRAGRVTADTKRIWPQAERIKAHVARCRSGTPGADPARVAALVEFLLSRYLLPDGGWYEMLGRDLAPVTRALPATSCYHLYSSLREALAVL